MPRVLVCIVTVSALTGIAHVPYVSPAAKDQQNNSGKSQSNGSPGIRIYEELFKTSFAYQRKEHTEAIKRLQKIDNYEHLYKIIMALGEKMVDVIGGSITLIENEGFNPDNRSLPQNVTIQNAISAILENTAFFGDILLHFPHITHRILKTQQKWNPIINWSLNFTYRTKYLLDKDTSVKIDLASQELNVIKREQGYFNPYWQPINSGNKDKREAKNKKLVKKKPKRGPQMTKIEL